MPRKYRYLDFIIWLDLTIMLISNITSGKIVHLGTLTVSAASIFFPITYIFSDVLTEVYGYAQSRRVTWLLIFASVLATILYEFVILLPPAPGFRGNEAYSLVLGQVPRVVLGGWLALFAGQISNDFILAKMKILTKGKYLWTRTIGSTIVGEFVDTALFYSVSLINVIPTGLLIASICSGWILKVLTEILMTPVTYKVVTKLKKAENEDYYDRATDFNPFIMKANHSP